MGVLRSHIRASSPDFAHRRTHHEGLAAELRSRIEAVSRGGPTKAIEVHRERGKLLPREGMTLPHEGAEAITGPVLETYEAEGNSYHATAQLWDDGITDPLDTRAVVVLALSASLNAPVTRGPAPVYRM